jgi:hypothetical protein
MFTRTRFAAVLAALAAIAALPAAAHAQSIAMRGVVSGSPYGASNGQMAIPVLFSKMTATNARLKSPVGVIILNRTQKVKLPDGTTTLPINLRTGDRFKGVGEVGSVQRRVFYPRVVFPTATVYFRSKELSLAELSAAVDSLRKSLSGLQNQLNTLRDGSVKAFADLYKQLGDLQKALASLKIPAGVDLTSIQSQIDGLTKKLNDLIASLPDFSKFALLSQLPDFTKFALLSQLPDLSSYALVSQLPDLSQYVTLGDLTTTLGDYATKTYVDNAIAGLQTQINALPTKTYVDSAIAGLQTQINALPTKTYVDSAIAGLQTQINALPTKTYVDTAIATLTTRVNQICTSLKGMSVTVPAGSGILSPVIANVSLPNIGTPCP